ncbi:hypothetical protein A9973_22835 [Achromobacter sp. UMC46]|nr:hypothetical protein [Achromobacter sp. UMC46]
MKRRSLLLAMAGLTLTPLHAIAAPERDAIIRQVYGAPAGTLVFTGQHAALMRELRAMWMPVESGAPAIDFEQPLLGGPDTLGTARKRLKTSDDALAIRRLAEVCRLIPRYVGSLGGLRPGRYAVPAEMKEAFDFPESGVDAQGGFDLRREHLTLLRAAAWREVDAQSLQAVLREGDRFWPMPYIDGKRPYGDASYYQIDMARLLGDPYPLDAKGYAVTDSAKDARFKRLHAETLAALQVFLTHAAPIKEKR